MQTNTIINSMNDALKKANIDPARLRTSFYYQPNNTKQLLADSMRKNIALSNMTCDQLKNVEDPKREQLSVLKLYFTPNIIGVILSQTLSVTMTSPYIHDCEQDKLITDLESKLVN